MGKGLKCLTQAHNSPYSGRGGFARRKSVYGLHPYPGRSKWAGPKRPREGLQSAPAAPSKKKNKKTRISAPTTRGLELQAIATAPLRVTLRYSTASRNASLRHDGVAVVEPIPAAALCFFTMLQALERKASTAPSASA